MKLKCETDCPALALCRSVSKEAKTKIHVATGANREMHNLQLLKRDGLIELVDRNPRFFESFDRGDRTTGQFLYGVLQAMRREKRHNRAIQEAQAPRTQAAERAEDLSQDCYGPRVVYSDDMSVRRRTTVEAVCGNFRVDMAADPEQLAGASLPESPNPPEVVALIEKLRDAQRVEQARARIEALGAVPA